MEETMIDLDRRAFNRSCFGVMLVATAAPLGSVLAQSDTETNLTKEQWMDMAANSKSIDSPLYMGRFLDPMYFLLEPISWSPNQQQAGRLPRITVPKGFVTDLASIPPLFFSWLRPDGPFVYAAIVHDFIYWDQTQSKDQADEILKVAMEDAKVSTLRLQAIYTAVTVAGQPAWDGNLKLKGRGEKRILSKFPPKADISWKEWKERSDVFAPG
jgi:hypothetical protein